MTEKLYTTAEAAEYLRISVKTLCQKTSARQIRYIHGRPNLFTESALKEYLKRREKRSLV